MKKYFQTILFPTIQKQIELIRSNPKESALLIGIFIIFLLNTLYLSYPDEFVNIMGGKAILEGKLPYRDFYDHHMPMAWYLAAALLKLSFGSFVIFRGWWAVFMFASLFTLGMWIRNNYRDIYPYYLGFFFLYPLISVYFWFQLYVGDGLASLFFALTFWMLIVQTLAKKYDYSALIFSSFLTFLLVFSSLSFIYLAAAFYLWQLYIVRFELRRTWKETFRYVFYIAIPYLVYGLFLVLTGTFGDFFFANVTYNTQNYIDIENYDRGSRFNPIKFAMTLIYNFGYNYLGLLSRLKEVELYLPIGQLAALGTFTLIVLFFFRNMWLAGILFLVLVFSAPRSTFNKINEGDYQISLFLVLGTACAIISLYLIRKLKDTDIFVKDLARVPAFILAVYLLFSGVFLLRNSYNKAFQILISKKMISINNIAPTAQFIDAAIREGQYYWIGPYEPHHTYFVKKGMLPGRHAFLMPQFKENPVLKKTFQSQFENHPPTVIVYKHDGHIFGTHALKFSDFFFAWMKGKYTKLSEIPGVQIKQTYPSFDMEKDVYIANADKEEVLGRLKSAGIIEYK